MKQHYRTWFPYMLIGLTVILSLGVILWVKHKMEEPTLTPAVQQIEAPTVEEYQAEIIKILDEYSIQEKRMEVYNALFGLTVPSEMRAVHIELVLLFDDASDTPASVKAGLNDLAIEYPWIP